jgi:hypothetical protein
MIKNIGIIGDRAGQLRESGEHWMGRRMSGLLSIQSFKVVALTYVDEGPCQLGLNEQALIMYWCIWDLWGPTILVASMVTELDDTLAYFKDV